MPSSLVTARCTLTKQPRKVVRKSARRLAASTTTAASSNSSNNLNINNTLFVKAGKLAMVVSTATASLAPGCAFAAASESLGELAQGGWFGWYFAPG
jgi:hypothetical protein